MSEFIFSLMELRLCLFCIGGMDLLDLYSLTFPPPTMT